MPTDNNAQPTLLSSKEAVENRRAVQSKIIQDFLKKGNPIPTLAIVQIKDDPVINTYVGAKKRYGSAIGAAVEIHKIAQKNALKTITALNNNPAIHGIIVQLPITDTSQTKEILEHVALEKDVDGLRRNSPFTPATPLAIMHILEYYAVDLATKQVVVVGRGALVGTPLMRILERKNIAYTELNSQTPDNEAQIRKADVILSATGRPGLIKAEDIQSGAIVIDAGTATAGGKTVGDVEDAAYDRTDITLTPKRGGVGPMTVSSLFDNLLEAYERQLN